MKPLEGSFISIGAGKNQIPLIRAAKERDLHIIGVDKNSTAPGFEDCDIRILESTSEYRKILLSMGKVPLTNKLLGVGTRSFGSASFSASYLSEKLKLPGNSSLAVSLFSNKKKMKVLMEKQGILVPKSQALPDKKKSEKKKTDLSFPLIAKPSSGFGKKGIQILEGEKDWSEFSKSAKTDQWILESKIDGDEVTVLGFVISKKFHILSLTDKITTGEPPFLEIAHIAPSRRIDMTGEIKMICQSIVNATGLQNGPFVAEFKINENGECYLMESAPEVGGEFIAEHLLKEHYGYSYFKDLISLYVGEKPKTKFLIKSPHKTKTSVILFRIPSKKQKLVAEEPEFPLEEGETIFFKDELLKPGTSLEKLEGNAKRAYVYGISTTKKVSSSEWVSHLQDRLNA
ncbi:ATP-grasp domain-containing protein [Leptospira idonii]|uniref:ATP-grasp domain-containing protein n=1 Tax=Leptospira idonii TaxID=1193500 RepID=A0A4V3JXY9_9LEPT|nr:ATP-grasp domain-containing protein [Leptospira idonii]TGN19286.1 ATP-grasp domain-containing protein [Leptospira idonii]